MNTASGSDRDPLDDAARQLAIDNGNSVQIADLTAVAITVLTWRESPVEDWHAVPHQKINDSEMMRANAATTRLVRDHLRDPLRVALASGDRVGMGDLLASSCELVTDLERQLPDGRAVRELAPCSDDLDLFREHVRTVAQRCAALARDVGGRETVSMLACFAAAYSWRWWLTPSWPRRIKEFMSRLEDPGRWQDPYMAKQVERLAADGNRSVDHDQLQRRLLAGPDRLDTAGADYCLRAGLHDIRPQDCGLAPVRRRALPRAYLDHVAHLSRPARSRVLP